VFGIRPALDALSSLGIGASRGAFFCAPSRHHRHGACGDRAFEMAGARARGAEEGVCRRRPSTHQGIAGRAPALASEPDKIFIISDAKILSDREGGDRDLRAGAREFGRQAPSISIVMGQLGPARRRCSAPSAQIEPGEKQLLPDDRR